MTSLQQRILSKLIPMASGDWKKIYNKLCIISLYGLTVLLLLLYLVMSELLSAEYKYKNLSVFVFLVMAIALYGGGGQNYNTNLKLNISYPLICDNLDALCVTHQRIKCS